MFLLSFLNPCIIKLERTLATGCFFLIMLDTIEHHPVTNIIEDLSQSWATSWKIVWVVFFYLGLSKELAHLGNGNESFQKKIRTSTSMRIFLNLLFSSWKHMDLRKHSPLLKVPSPSIPGNCIMFQRLSPQHRLACHELIYCIICVQDI